jgi:hypothetical protein
MEALERLAIEHKLNKHGADLEMVYHHTVQVLAACGTDFSLLQQYGKERHDSRYARHGYRKASRHDTRQRGPGAADLRLFVCICLLLSVLWIVGIGSPDMLPEGSSL